MTSSDRIFVAILSLLFATLAYVTIRLFLFRKQRLSRARLIEDIEARSSMQRNELQESQLAPVFSFTEKFFESKYGKWIKQTAAKAGVWEQEELNRFLAKKIRLALAALILVATLNVFFSLPLILVLFVPLFAFFFPDLSLMDKARSRIAEIARILPDTIDLLNMCVSAGIGFHSGMQRVAASKDNPLSQEFSRVLSEMKLGQGRGPALLALSDRLRIESLDQFVNSVLQVDRLGIPLNRVLEEQSRRLRGARREKAREQAQKLPVKILAPTMIFLLPALLIIVLGPAVISIVRSFG